MGSSPIPATRPVGQAAKTPPFHGGNMGSIPVRVTNTKSTDAIASVLFVLVTRTRNLTRQCKPYGLHCGFAYPARRSESGSRSETFSRRRARVFSPKARFPYFTLAFSRHDTGDSPRCHGLRARRQCGRRDVKPRPTGRFVRAVRRLRYDVSPYGRTEYATRSCGLPQEKI